MRTDTEIREERARRDALDRILDRVEPDSLPSGRYNRVTRARNESVAVLELRDPNDGQDPDPATKQRHQYVRSGGIVWRRVLPPESVGDEWADTGAPRWEPVEQLAGILREAAPHLPAARVAVLRRLRSQDASRRTRYEVRGEYVAADDVEDVRVVAGPVTADLAAVPLPPCPDCGGDVVWYEAGYVPWARRCVGQPIREDDGLPVYDDEGGCGSMFTVETE